MSGIVLGFVGVIIILNPGVEGFGIQSLLPVFSAFSYSCAQIMVRTMGLNTKATVMGFYSNSVYLVAGLFMAVGFSFVNVESENLSVQFLFRSWAMPGFQDGLLIMVTGLATAWASVLSSQAYQMGEASKIATMEYTPIIWVVIFGYLFLSEVPDHRTILGVIVIVAAGLYVIKREEIKTKKPLARNGLKR
ncbi:MAG: EamA family transporter [Gammaproteobacteria bacterium]|nr:EamA family transporter [Gammaproteobacteria bacterium]